MAQAAPPDNSQPSWTQQFSGYFKDLASGSRSYFTQDAWADNLDRLRLTYDGKYQDWLAVHVDYDNEVHAGNLIGLPDFGARARPPERGLARSPARLREPPQPVLGHLSLSRICFAAQRLGDSDGWAPAHRLGDGALLEPHGHVQSDQPAADRIRRNARAWTPPCSNSVPRAHCGGARFTRPRTASAAPLQRSVSAGRFTITISMSRRPVSARIGPPGSTSPARFGAPECAAN